MKRILVTGGSGFIGTNLVEACLSAGDEVLSIDIEEPGNGDHLKVFRKVNILDRVALDDVFRDFAPVCVVHLAARTDLDANSDLDGYSANVKGVQNVVDAVSGQTSVKRCIFASTKLVCPTDYKVKSEYDYCPDTMYGQSKVAGEKIVRDCTTMCCDWCIVRPTSIWGPWADVPYGKFFRMVGRGFYFHPGRVDLPKSFGYVGNVVFQIRKILDAPREQIHQKVFYLSDYDTFTIRNWADTISAKLRNRRVRTFPEPVVRLIAWAGDLMKLCGIKEPPFSSFRLRNMQADTTGIPLEPIRRLTGPLPFSMKEGVEETVEWFRKHNLIQRGGL